MKIALPHAQSPGAEPLTCPDDLFLADHSLLIEASVGATRKIVGGVASPLLANLYMRRFVLGWKVLGHAARLNAHIVNYADDFVICCRGTAEEAMTVMRTMMSKLRR